MVNAAWRIRLWGILKVGVAAGMMFLLWQQGVLDPTLLDHFIQQPALLPVALACNLAMISLGAVRWHILLRSQDILLPFAWSHGMTYLAFCFNLLVPGSVGGDALRMSYLLRHCAAPQKSAAIITILADRATGLYAMFVIATLAALANQAVLLTTVSGQILMLSLSLTLLGVPLLVGLFFWGMARLPQYSGTNKEATSPPQHNALLKQLFQTAHSFRQHKKHLLAAVAVSALAQALEILALIWIARHLGLLNTSGDHFFLAAPMAWIANLLPVSPGGLGVGEAAFAQICQWLQPESNLSALGTPFLINRILQIMASLPGLGVYLRYRPPS
jgi:uncharacterized protein (TIRG00374 family)